MFVVDAKGGARITNVPEDYKTVQAKEKIISYAQAVQIERAHLSDRSRN